MQTRWSEGGKTNCARGSLYLTHQLSPLRETTLPCHIKCSEDERNLHSRSIVDPTKRRFAILLLWKKKRRVAYIQTTRSVMRVAFFLLLLLLAFAVAQCGANTHWQVYGKVVSRNGESWWGRYNEPRAQYTTTITSILRYDRLPTAA